MNQLWASTGTHAMIVYFKQNPQKDSYKSYATPGPANMVKQRLDAQLLENWVTAMRIGRLIEFCHRHTKKISNICSTL